MRRAVSMSAGRQYSYATIVYGKRALRRLEVFAKSNAKRKATEVTGGTKIIDTVH